MTNDESENHDWSINRRTAMKAAGMASMGVYGSTSFIGAAVADDHCGPGCDSTCEEEVPLCAGQHIDVGTVHIRRVPGEDQLKVEYVLDGDTENDWYLLETHLYVGKTDPSELSSAPGQFPFSEDDYGDGVISDTYTIDFDEICEYELGGGRGKGGKWEEVDDSCGVEEDDCVWIAAHAVVDEVLIEAPYFAADATYEAEQGVKKNGDPIDADRSDPEDGLVKTYPDGDFFSFGFMPDGEGGFEDEGGWLEVTFDCPVVNGDGDDLRLWEVTFADYPEESADVYAWYDDKWVYLGQADNSGQGDEGSPEAHTLSTFDLGNPADEDYEEVPMTTKLKIVDTTDPGPHNGNADAFDLDGIEVLQDCTEDETAWGNGCDGCEITDGGNWATKFQYGIGSDCGEETLPECPLYGTSREGETGDTVQIWSIQYDSENDEVVEVVVGDIPDESSSENYPNGLAFDPANEVWYFAAEGGVLHTMNEDGSLGIVEYNDGNSISGGSDIAGAAYYDGEYYFTPQGGDTLWKATLDTTDPSETTVTVDDDVCDFPSGVGAGVFGDIAIDSDGIAYFSVQDSTEAKGKFFKIDLDDCGSEIIKEPFPQSQIAFANDVLWAHDAGSGDWQIVDVSDGSLSDVVDTTRTYTDLGQCGVVESE